jgi:hypothetical protein
MTALNKYFISSEDRLVLNKLIGVLQKCGNRQRALSSIFSLFTQLKLGLAGFPIVKNYPLHTLDAKNPIHLIHKCLYKLKPAFFLRRIIKSGKRYDLPVPISDKRATFMAIDWLRKTVLKNNKNEHSFATLLAQEISASLHHKGSSYNFLKAYIDIALDQRPFSKLIKRRRFNVSKSKRTPIAKKFKKIQKNIRRNLRVRKYRSKGVTRKMNMHNIRAAKMTKLRRLSRKPSNTKPTLKKQRTRKAKK